MSTIHKYWVKEFIKFFLIVQLIILCIFVSVDYLTHMNKFLKVDMPLFKAFEYVILKLPFMFVQLTPAGTVLAGILAFGIMNRNNELMALKSSGISVYYLIKPAFYTGLFLAAMMFFLSETLVPVTMSGSNHIYNSYIRHHGRIYSARENIWIKGDNTIAHFKYFNPIDKTISGITLSFFNNNFKMTGRVDAEKGIFKNGSWHLSHVLEQKYKNGKENNMVKSYKFKDFKLDILPKDLQKIVKKSEEMSFSELSAYIKKVEKEGYDASSYKVDLFGRTAFPFICIIMVLTGAATGIRPGIKENFPLGIAIGIIVSFFYWVMFGFCTSLGYGKMLPPFISAWATNFFFFFFSLIYLINAD